FLQTPRGGSKPIPRCERSRLSQSPPMRSTEKSGLRGRLAAMTMCRNLSAHANCLRKFAGISNSCPLAASAFLMDNGDLRVNDHAQLRSAAPLHKLGFHCLLGASMREYHHSLAM